MTFIPLMGGCCCGAIRYKAHAMPFDADYCHCEQCRKSVGAVVASWMDFNADEVTMEGETLVEFASSDTVRRGFCGRCGTSLTYRHTGYPQYLTLSIASLDKPELVEPKYHIHTGNQVSWLVIEDDCPRYVNARSAG